MSGRSLDAGLSPLTPWDRDLHRNQHSDAQLTGHPQAPRDVLNSVSGPVLPTPPTPVLTTHDNPRRCPTSPGDWVAPRTRSRRDLAGIDASPAWQVDTRMCTGMPVPGDGQEGLAAELLFDGTLQAVGMAVAGSVPMVGQQRHQQEEHVYQEALGAGTALGSANPSVAHRHGTGQQTARGQGAWCQWGGTDTRQHPARGADRWSLQRQRRWPVGPARLLIEPGMGRGTAGHRHRELGPRGAGRGREDHRAHARGLRGRTCKKVRFRPDTGQESGSPSASRAAS